MYCSDCAYLSHITPVVGVTPDIDLVSYPVLVADAGAKSWKV